MSRARFVKLIEEFCRLSNLDPPERIVRGDPVMVNEVAFNLIQSDTVDPGLLFIYADFGQLPTRREAQACMALMEANLFLYNGKGAAFSISPDTRRVVFVESRALEKITAEELRSLLIGLSAHAREWRSNYFLDIKGSTSHARRRVFESLHLNLKK